jgi:hypothetical protein
VWNAQIEIGTDRERVTASRQRFLAWLWRKWTKSYVLLLTAQKMAIRNFELKKASIEGGR